MGYLTAVLQQRGYTVEMLDIRDGPTRIADYLRARDPVLVGFSLIFQYFLPQYRHLASYLREAGITCHFTIGGHYPSLCHEELLKNFPEIDSVVRYEGEITLAELASCLVSGGDWRKTQGIAYRNQGQIVLAEPRPLVPDLDSLPFPARPFEPEHVGGFPTLPLLASRGCARRCSFCSIHTFYRTAPGKVVRVRKPEKVVEEMLMLHHEHGIRVFLFQDDDFPLWGKPGRRWAEELVGRIHDCGLNEQAVWKISCRAEYVEPELFGILRNAGLFLVYMGIESGTDQGLEILNKEITAEQNIAAVQILKDLGILFSYGFMLFDPSSTFESVRENVNFLRQIVGDGSAPATFCRMLPYGGTPIRDRLEKEGRLRGDLTHPDYEFLDLRLNQYHRLLSDTVRPWIHNEGLSHFLSSISDELEAVVRLIPDVQGAETYRANVKSITAESNERLFRLVEESSLSFERSGHLEVNSNDIRDYCENTAEELASLRNEFVATNIKLLAETTNPNHASGPVLTPQIH